MLFFMTSYLLFANPSFFIDSASGQYFCLSSLIRGRILERSAATLSVLRKIVICDINRQEDG